MKNRGLAYADLGQCQQVITDLDQAIRLDPQHTDAYYNRGTVTASLGKYPQAVLDLAKAIRLDHDKGQCLCSPSSGVYHAR